MGYDIGNVMANLMFAWARGHAMEEQDFTSWTEHTLVDVIEQFTSKFHETWDTYVTELTAKNQHFKEDYLRNVLKDTAGMAGLELARRIVGLAKVKDITTVEPIEKRLQAERICLRVAIELIMHPEQFESGESYIVAIQNARQEESK